MENDNDGAAEALASQRRAASLDGVEQSAEARREPHTTDEVNAIAAAARQANISVGGLIARTDQIERDVTKMMGTMAIFAGCVLVLAIGVQRIIITAAKAADEAAGA